MLKRRAIDAVRWTGTSALLRACLQVAQLAVLARLLDPSDFGLMAIVMVVVAYGSLFADAGLSSAVIQRRHLGLEERSSIYWFNVGAAMVVGLLIAVAAPLIARAYGDSRVAVLMWICAPMFAVTAAGRQIEAMAERSIAFRTLSVNEVVAPAIGAVVAVSAASFGAGAKSLAFGAVSAAAIRSTLAWLLLPAVWRPRWHASWAEVRAHWSFGGSLTLSNIVNQVTLTADIVLGARVLGIDLIGVYSAPRQLVHSVLGIINPVITRVTFPLIAEVQADRSKVLNAYRETIRVTGGVNAPIYLGLTILGPEVCLVVLGPSWKDAGFLLSALSLAGLMRAMVNPVGSLLLGIGRADAALRWNLATLGVGVPVLLIGAAYGIQGLALASVLLGGMLFVPAWNWLIRPFICWHLRDYLAITMRPILLAVCAVVGGRVVASASDDVGLRVLLTVCTALPAYLLLSARFNPEFVSRMREVLGR